MLVVVLVGLVVDGGTGGFWPSLLATAVVALAFQPLRRRVVRVADRLAFGAAAAPYEALADFSRRLGDSPDPSDLLPAVAERPRQAVNASRVVGHARRRGRSRPDGHLATGGERIDRRTSVSPIPVVDRGERLGSITLRCRPDTRCVPASSGCSATWPTRPAGLPQHRGWQPSCRVRWSSWAVAPTSWPSPAAADHRRRRRAEPTRTGHRRTGDPAPGPAPGPLRQLSVTRRHADDRPWTPHCCDRLVDVDSTPRWKRCGRSPGACSRPSSPAPACPPRCASLSPEPEHRAARGRGARRRTALRIRGSRRRPTSALPRRPATSTTRSVDLAGGRRRCSGWSPRARIARGIARDDIRDRVEAAGGTCRVTTSSGDITVVVRRVSLPDHTSSQPIRSERAPS